MKWIAVKVLAGAAIVLAAACSTSGHKASSPSPAPPSPAPPSTGPATSAAPQSSAAVPDAAAIPDDTFKQMRGYFAQGRLATASDLLASGWTCNERLMFESLSSNAEDGADSFSFSQNAAILYWDVGNAGAPVAVDADKTVSQTDGARDDRGSSTYFFRIWSGHLVVEAGLPQADLLNAVNPGADVTAVWAVPTLSDSSLVVWGYYLCKPDGQ